MNTITQTASTTTIFSIDLGKYKSVTCIHVQGMGEWEFARSPRRGPSYTSWSARSGAP
jgi:hypothetical protein